MLAIDTYTRCLKRLGKEELARGDDNDNPDYNDGTGTGTGGGDGNNSSSSGGDGRGGSSSSGGVSTGDDGDMDNGPLIADCLYQLAQCHLALNNYPQAQVGDRR